MTLPKPLHKDFYVGMAYVTLGSALGARIIEKKLDLMEQFNKNEYSFYSFDPEEHKRWGVFLKYLQNNEKKLDQQAVINGAVQSFEYFFILYDHTK